MITITEIQLGFFHGPGLSNHGIHHGDSEFQGLTLRYAQIIVGSRISWAFKWEFMGFDEHLMGIHGIQWE